MSSGVNEISELIWLKWRFFSSLEYCVTESEQYVKETENILWVDSMFSYLVIVDVLFHCHFVFGLECFLSVRHSLLLRRFHCVWENIFLLSLLLILIQMSSFPSQMINSILASNKSEENIGEKLMNLVVATRKFICICDHVNFQSIHAWSPLS